MLFLIGIVLFVVAVSLPKHEAKLQGWLLVAGLALWTIGGY